MAKAANLKEAFKISGVRLPVKAQVAGEHLMRLYKKRGELTPEIILADAKDEASVMHPCFEWNDKKAAEKWRLDQASQIIRCITVVRYAGDKKIEVRAFVNIKKDAAGTLTHGKFLSKSVGDKSYYVSMTDAMQNEAMRKYTVDAALLDLQRWVHKYENVKELSAFVVQIKKGIKQNERKAVA